MESKGTNKRSKMLLLVAFRSQYNHFLVVTDSAFRLNVSEADLPRIPAHPIGYDDARVLLRYARQ